jgi:hypothetical protein
MLESAAKLTTGAVAVSALKGTVVKAAPFAFFDTCTCHPDPANSRFVINNKMNPVRKGVEKILAAAERLGAPVLSTTCMGAQRSNPKMSVAETVGRVRSSAASAGLPPGEAFVRVNATPEEVADAVKCKHIRIERLSCANSNESCQSGTENVERRTYDMFYSNKNTAKIVRALGERHWLVFGGGGEYCLVAAAEGLRSLGLPVTILVEGCIHMAFSTPESFLRAFDRLRSLGVEWAKLESVMKEKA